MKLLIIGFGSIGSRHGRLAEDAGLEVACVTRNPVCPYRCFDSVESAIASWHPERVIISNATAEHLKTLRQLDVAGYSGLTLIEKPLFDKPTNYIPLHPERIFVAYNMRFHPLTLRLRELVSDLPLYSSEFHVGQYLPDWRPSTDYRQSYSAWKQQGGGVLRDLSHELDLAFWLCGDVRSLAAIGGHFSDLEIDSDDVFMVLARTDRCPAVAITLNYLNRSPQRIVRVNAQGITVTVNFVTGSLDLNGECFTYAVERDRMYRDQLMNFVECDRSVLCSFGEGSRIARVIALCEQVSQKSQYDCGDY